MITMINACGGRRTVVSAIFLLSVMSLSGCVGGSKTNLNSVKKLSQNNPNDKSDEQRIALCQQRVNSLKILIRRVTKNALPILTVCFPTLPDMPACAAMWMKAPVKRLMLFINIKPRNSAPTLNMS
ncbi:hypothetical protein [Serratia sp. SCBI]|uniref:hypothetical protein n=1 Tax=Serratia sp. SCBI TaxID=488142 RepID=UPI001E561869|nr:hypothetical protein [Serratia sp. SCBI]